MTVGHMKYDLSGYSANARLPCRRLSLSLAASPIQPHGSNENPLVGPTQIKITFYGATVAWVMDVR